MNSSGGRRTGVWAVSLCALAGMGLAWAIHSCVRECTSSASVRETRATKARRPNVLLFSIDTLRADHLSSYGYERRTTPMIDVFAQQGVLFEQAYSHSPKTAPSHMSLMTSLYPEAHGVRQLSHAEARRLSKDIPTLASVLQQHGYRTGAITAGGNTSAELGFDQGMHSYQTIYDVSTLMDSAAVQLDAMQSVLPEREPLFLFLHTYEVHDPYTPRSPYHQMFSDPNYAGRIADPSHELSGDDEVFARSHKLFWEGVDRNDPRDLQHLLDLYDGSLRRVDTDFAALLRWMRARGIFDDTLIVILSDHGEEFKDHGGFLHTHVYQEILHVPLIFIFPREDRQRFAGRRIAAPVRLIDVMPTILDYLDIPAPDGLQGVSLLPVLDDTGAPPEALVMSSYSRRGYLALREAGWKLIEHTRRRLSGEGFVTTRELYDLSADPGERRNLAKGEAERVTRLSARAAEIDAAARAAFERAEPGPLIEADDQTVEELRALGYVD